MTCLRCGERQKLVAAVDLRGVPHGDAGHDTVYDWSTVLSCPTCGHGELRVFSHDCWAPPWEEEWDMEFSAEIPPEPLALIKRGMAGCPDPSAVACECPTHVSLRDSRTRPRKLRISPPKEGERPNAHVALRDDGVPEFADAPRSR